MASELFFRHLMTELCGIGNIQLESGSFNELLVIITFPSEVSVCPQSCEYYLMWCV